MTHQAPSRLPTAFVRVSKCPICRYSLKDLKNDAPCPECGHVVDRGILGSPELHKAVLQTKDWCTIGIGSWSLIGVLHALPAFLTYTDMFSGKYSAQHLLGMAIITLVILAMIAICIYWHSVASLLVYRVSYNSQHKCAVLPKRVVAVSVLGIGAVLLITGMCMLNL